MITLKLEMYKYHSVEEKEQERFFILSFDNNDKIGSPLAFTNILENYTLLLRQKNHYSKNLLRSTVSDSAVKTTSYKGRGKNLLINKIDGEENDGW